MTMPRVLHGCKVVSREKICLVAAGWSNPRGNGAGPKSLYVRTDMAILRASRRKRILAWGMQTLLDQRRARPGLVRERRDLLDRRQPVADRVDCRRRGLVRRRHRRGGRLPPGAVSTGGRRTLPCGGRHAGDLFQRGFQQHRPAARPESRAIVGARRQL